ncbi:WbuC family cupin fold metalloprotein [Zoogloea sp.]|uniref:WbuC family cupin fold metalloprotein n=1 Tax=Zoogloea sp. TaxID=49181 RepID=UPI00262E1CFA|nr:WbuC family cupin fold metalloprotein [Zoogloea sp.]MDD3352763.1 WbuC family cupin fold metalloprotein [Zoogloea sp.]
MLTYERLIELSLAAVGSGRGRMHLNLHPSYVDPCQRLFNAIGEQSYIRPHRHSIDPRVETLIAVRGLFGLITFDDEGVPSRVELFGSELHAGVGCTSVGVEVFPDEWHMVVALAPQSVVFEVKAGPFDPAGAKEFAPWSPPEGTQMAAEFLEEMRRFAKQSTGVGV